MFCHTLSKENTHTKGSAISTKLGQNVCDHKISDEFDYGFNPTKTELFALEFAKLAESDFVYTLASINVDQLVPNIVTMCMTVRSWIKWIKSDSNIWSYLPLNKEKLFNSFLKDKF